MNNSFARLIDGMCATLRAEVLPRVDDEFARGQVFGVINLLNTFKTRADWSAGFLLQQIEAQRQAFLAIRSALDEPLLRGAPDLPPDDLPAATPVADLMARRDVGNAAIAAWLHWLDARAAPLDTERRAIVEGALRRSMRAEVDLELRNAPRPLFAEMSSGRED